MNGSGYPAHRIASSGLFSLFSLLALALGMGEARPLALATGGSLFALFVFTRAGFRAALGPFAPSLATLADLALLFCALSLTGGFRSPYGLLLPAGVALAWHLEGKSAARFYAAVAVLGVAALVTLGGGELPPPAELFPLLAVGLAAPALLAALESLGGDRAGKESAGASGSGPVSLASTATEAARDRNEEVLHDLKSPLSVMRVYADLISEGARRGELPNPEHLANLSREIELAERLAGGTTLPASRAAAPAGEMRFDLSPPAAPVATAAPAPPASADLVEILGSLATAYRLSSGGRLRIEFIAERPELPVTADPVALQRAFRNVLENAVKYTPQGGEVRIRAGAAGPHAFVVVKDTGMGMSDEERARAFDFAFRGAGAVAAGTRGKGLGLALTKEILEANGGKISLSSEAGYGSEVTILLPFYKR
ncbi:MAG TPA: HAMP domain-containing sensor histidine kinase [Thermoanaerobaculia bacterium]|nr:HAMP domain-containing sensor histidine kinase [Thermoanaerobaculia bacterium]